MSRRALEFLAERGVRDPPRLELPLRSRYPHRLARRLSSPARGIDGAYWFLVCRGLRCWPCGFPEPPRVRVERVLGDDVLSDLRHPVPRLVVECCGRVVAVSRWDGSRVVVEDIECVLGW